MGHCTPVRSGILSFSVMDESADIWFIEISLTQRQVLHIIPNVEQFKLSI